MHAILGSTPLAAALVPAVLLAGYWAARARRLVQLRRRVFEAWSDVEALLARRHELVADLVAATHAGAPRVDELLERISSLRARAVELVARGLPEPGASGHVEDLLERALEDLVALRDDERAPGWAHEAGDRATRELEAVRARLTAAGRAYDEAARDLNAAVRRAPDLGVTHVLGISTVPYFRGEATAER